MLNKRCVLSLYAFTMLSGIKFAVAEQSAKLCVHCEQFTSALTWLLLCTVAPYNADRLNRCERCGFKAAAPVVLAVVVVGNTAALTPVCWPAINQEYMYQEQQHRA
jgi:hypothetical protein